MPMANTRNGTSTGTADCSAGGHCGFVTDGSGVCLAPGVHQPFDEDKHLRRVGGLLASFLMRRGNERGRQIGWSIAQNLGMKDIGPLAFTGIDTPVALVAFLLLFFAWILLIVQINAECRQDPMQRGCPPELRAK